MRRFAILSTAVLLALGAAACGEKEEAPVAPSSATTAPTSTSTTLADVAAAEEEAPKAPVNEAFIEKADAACAADHEAKSRIDPPANNDEVIAYLRRVLPIEENAAQSLADLGTPPANASLWKETLDYQMKVLDRVRGMLHDSSTTGDDIVADAKIKEWQAKANSGFVKFGLKVCGKP